MNYSISVIIPAYNYGRFLSQAIDSAIAQTLPPSEIIIVDDGSTDDTPDIVAGYGKLVRVVRKANEGLAAARNTGAQIASGDILAFLDADDIWLPTKLEKQLQLLASEPELGLVHCGVEDVGTSGTVLQVRLEGMQGYVADELALLRRPVVIAAGSTALVPRAVFKAIGGFDSRLRFSEDWDFCYRLARRYKVGFVPEVLAQYRQHGANMHRDIRTMERSMLFAFEKAFDDPPPQLRRLRRRCYGNLHSILAGSFLHSKQYRRFVYHSFKALLMTPENSLRFIGYPIRLWNRSKLKYRGRNLSRRASSYFE